MRTIWSEGTQPAGPLELRLITYWCLWPPPHSGLPSLPDCPENLLIWVCSIWTVPFRLMQIFPLSFFLEQFIYFIVYCAFILYLFIPLWFTNLFCLQLFYSAPFDSFCSTVFQNCCFKYCWIFLVIVRYSDTGNVFQKFWTRKEVTITFTYNFESMNIIHYKDPPTFLLPQYMLAGIHRTHFSDWSQRRARQSECIYVYRSKLPGGEKSE
jgi:hypothetical protein